MKSQVVRASAAALVALAIVASTTPARAEWPPVGRVLELAKERSLAGKDANAQVAVAQSFQTWARLPWLTNPYVEFQANKGPSTKDIAFYSFMMIPIEINGQRGARIDEADAMLRWRATARDDVKWRTAGDAVANWLIQNAEAIGVQFIVWDRSSWNASRPPGTKLRAYTGPHPHNDHLHVELTIAGANRRTAWFRAPAPPAPTPPAPTPPAPTPATPSEPAARTMSVVGINLRVTAGSLNLRSGPGTGYRIVDVMSCGESARVLGTPVSGWWNVSYQGTAGWASSTFLQTDATFNPAACR